MTEPVSEAEQISGIAFGFMASKALFVALHMDLFSQLSAKPRTAQALADDIGLPENRVATVLTALATTGLVVKQADIYQNSPGAESFLVRGARNDFGDYLRYQIDRQMFPFMNQLEDVVFDRPGDNRVDSYAKWMDNEKEAHLYSESQHAGSLGPGRTLGRLIDFSKAHHLLDIAGGTGGMAIRLCEAYPQLQVTILDFPNVVSLGRQKVSQAGLQDRITFIAGNALETDWPVAVDAVLMSYLVSGVPGDSVAGLFKHAASVLNPKGRLIVHDFMVDDDKSGPALAALWQLQHLAFTPDAVGATPGWVSDLMRGAGLTPAGNEVMIPGMTRVIWSEK